jgi:TPR repeat protein
MVGIESLVGADHGMMASMIKRVYGLREANGPQLAEEVLERYTRGELPGTAADALAHAMLAEGQADGAKAGAMLRAKLAQSGCVGSLYNLAIDKLLGRRTAIDAEGANALLRRVIAQNTSEYPGLRAMALCALGESLSGGRGCQQDEKEAVRLFEEAAALGSGDAAFNAALHYNGKTSDSAVPVDFDRAAALYKVAAEAGMVNAQTNLGLLHVGGLFNGADPQTGLNLLKQSVEQGDEVAVDALEAIFRELEGVDGDGVDLSNAPRDNKEVVRRAGIAEETQRKMTALIQEAASFRLEEVKSFDELWKVVEPAIGPEAVEAFGGEGVKACLAMPAAIARWLKCRRPDLLARGELRIALLGASKMEFLSMFGVVPALCGTQGLKLSLDLVGPETPGVLTEWGLDVVRALPQSAGAYASRAANLDGLSLAVAFHPGLEKHCKEWIVDDDGFVRIAEAGIDIMCASYAPEEYLMDAAYATAFGLEAVECEQNPLRFGRGEGEPGIDTWSCWGLWRLRSGPAGARGDDAERVMDELDSVANMAASLIKGDGEAGVNHGDLRKLGRRLLLRCDGAYEEYVRLVRGFAVRTSNGELVRVVGEDLGGSVGTSVPAGLMRSLPAEDASWVDKARWTNAVWRQRLLPWLERGHDRASTLHALVGGAAVVSDQMLHTVLKVRPGTREAHAVRQMLKGR